MMASIALRCNDLPFRARRWCRPISFRYLMSVLAVTAVLGLDPENRPTVHDFAVRVSNDMDGRAQDAMGVGGRGDMYPVDCPKPTKSMPMTEQPAAATAFDHNSTLVLALELSGKGWQVGAVLPGVTRRPRRSVAPRDVAGLLTQIERWKAEAQRAGRAVRYSVGLRSGSRRVLDRAVSAGAWHRGADHASGEHPGGTAGAAGEACPRA